MVSPFIERTTSPGRCALPSGMFSTSPTSPTTLAGALRSASVLITPATTPAPPMSIVISSMPAAGLIEMPPVSKTTPLPTSAKGALLAAALPLHDHDLRRALRPLPDREERAHPERLELGLLQHLDLDPELAQADEPVGELGGGRARWRARSRGRG